LDLGAAGHGGRLYPHMFKLPEVLELLDLPEVHVSSLDQFMLGSTYRKAAGFLGNISVDEFRCDHARRWWCMPWSGEEYEASHPRLVGRQLAIPWESWNPSMMRPREPAGDYLSRAAARYPRDLNVHLADVLMQRLPVKDAASGGAGAGARLPQSVAA
jgi:hypothetical protein